MRRGPERAAGRGPGLVGLMAYSFGGMIGSGWLMAAGQGAIVRAGDWAWLAWLLAGLVMLITGLVMTELADRLKRDGGLVWWSYDSSGPMTAIIVTAAIWIFYALNPASEAAAAVQFAGHWASWLYPGDKTGGAPTKWGLAVSASLVALMVLINLLGLRLVTTVTSVASGFKVVIPVLVLGLLIWADIGPRSVPPSAHPVTWQDVMGAITRGGIIYTYVGFQAPIDLGGRARVSGPGKTNPNIPRAVIAPLLFGIVIFTMLQVLATRDAFYSPYTELAVGLSGWAMLAEGLIRADSIISPLGSGIVFSTALLQTVAEASKQKLINVKLHEPALFPWRLLGINFFLSLILLLSLHQWSSLAEESSATILFIYTVPSVALAVLAKQKRTGSAPPTPAPGKWFSLAIRTCLPLPSFVLMTFILFWTSIRVLALGAAATTVITMLLVLTRPKTGRLVRGRLWTDSRTPAWLLVAYVAGLLVLCTLRTHSGDVVRYLWDWPWATVGDVLAPVWGVAAFFLLVWVSGRYRKANPEVQETSLSSSD